MIKTGEDWPILNKYTRPSVTAKTVYSIGRPRTWSVPDRSDARDAVHDPVHDEERDLRAGLLPS